MPANRSRPNRQLDETHWTYFKNHTSRTSRTSLCPCYRIPVRIDSGHGPRDRLTARGLTAAGRAGRGPHRVQHLIKIVEDGALHDLGAHGLVGFLQEVEQVRNQLPVVDRAVIQHSVEQGVPKLLCQPTMARVLATGLRLSAAEAGRRVRAAEHLAERYTMTGEPLGPYRPHLAEAQRHGTITPEQVQMIDRALRGVDGRGFDPADIDAGEQILTEAATSVGPEDLKNLAAKVVDGIDPDGSLIDEKQHHDRRFLHLRQRPDGSWHGEFRLTPQAGQKFATLLDTLGRPITTRCEVGGDGDDGQEQSRRSSIQTSGRAGNGSTTRWRRCWTGCCAATSCPRPAAPRPPC
jgi:hypothetical protein